MPPFTTRFDQLRDLLHGPPSLGAWLAMSALLEGWPPDEDLPIALEYAAGVLDSAWPDALRPPPPAWREAFLAGAPPPAWALVRACDVVLLRIVGAAVPTIRIVWRNAGHPLRLAKALADGAPTIILRGLGLREAQDLAERLHGSNAEALLIPTHLPPTPPDAEALQRSRLELAAAGLPELVWLSRNPDPARRLAAVERLSSLSAADFAEDLLPRLDDPDPVVRDVAFNALATLTEGEVLQLFPNARTRISAHARAALLPRIRPQALGALQRVYGGDDEPETRAAALRWLAHLDPPDAPVLLRRGLRSPDASVREAAVQAAHQLTAREAPGVARALLDEGDGLSRVDAIRVLCASDPAHPDLHAALRACPELVGEVAQAFAQRAELDDDLHPVLVDLLRDALKAAPTAACDEALVACLRTDVPSLRALAASWIEATPGLANNRRLAHLRPGDRPDAEDLLLGLLQRGALAWSRWPVLQVTARFSCPALIPYLRALVTITPPSVEDTPLLLAALNANATQASCAEQLVSLLDEPDSAMRSAVARLLGRLRVERARSALKGLALGMDDGLARTAQGALDLLDGAPDPLDTPSTSIEQLQRLVACGDPGAIRLLAARIQEASGYVRGEVISQSLLRRHPHDLPLIVLALDDHTPTPRIRALRALGDLGDLSHISQLQQLTLTPDLRVARAAAAALRTLNRRLDAENRPLES